MPSALPGFIKRGAGVTGRAAACVGIILTGVLSPASAHDFYGAYVQHRLQLAISAKHIELSVELTFFEQWSAHERELMDSDGSGRITQVEIDRYVTILADELARQLTLRVGSRKVPLAFLYEPEVDLLGSNKIGQGHHRLELLLFAPTPRELARGDQFMIEDRLWPHAKALAGFQITGHDACVLEPEKRQCSGFAQLDIGKARVFKATCLTPPAFAPRLANPATARGHLPH